MFQVYIDRRFKYCVNKDRRQSFYRHHRIIFNECRARKSRGEASLANFTDNPERIGKNKSRKKNKNIADAETAEATQQLGTEDKNHLPNPDDNEKETQTAKPTIKMYLPDLNNIPLSQALKNGLDY